MVFKGRKPILTPKLPRPPSAHPGRESLQNLPRPYRKHKAEMKRIKDMQDPHVDADRFRYTVSERDARVQCQPEGVVAIHILELHDVSIRVTSFDESLPMFFYCLVSIGTLRRMSKVCKSDNRHRVRMDSTIYFTVELNEERDDYRNKLRVELWAFQEPELHYILGMKESHVYRIVQTVHGIESKMMWSDGLRAATITYEYAFSYGVFGFGHSDQLKNTDKSVFESVNNSMFPRIRLAPLDSIENKFNTRIPTRMQVMSVNSFIFEEMEAKEKGFYTETNSLANASPNIEPRFFTAYQVEFEEGIPVYCKVNMNIFQKEFQADFNDSYGEFICLTSRKARIEYLRGLLNGRLEDLIESEVGPLFMDLDEGVIENVLDSELSPGLITYPTKRPCMEYTPAVLSKEDEPFFASFPSTTFSPGWLARVFGYAEPSTDPHFGEGDFPLPDPKKAAEVQVVKFGCFQRTTFYIKYVWNIVASGLYTFAQFLFPELRRSREIPEISVTLISPEGSTTDLYTQWVVSELDHPLHLSEKKAAQESNLASIQKEKKAFDAEDRDSSDESLQAGSDFQIEDDDVLDVQDKK